MIRRPSSARLRRFSTRCERITSFCFVRGPLIVAVPAVLTVGTVALAGASAAVYPTAILVGMVCIMFGIVGVCCWLAAMANFLAKSKRWKSGLLVALLFGTFSIWAAVSAMWAFLTGVGWLKAR